MSPVDGDELQQRLRSLFVEELDEHVDVLNRGILQLEQEMGEAPPEVVQQLFRAAHSLKGAAHSAGVDPVAVLCHRLEQLLAAIRDGRQAVDQDVIDMLFAAADAVAQARVPLRDGLEPAIADIEDHVARFDEAFGPQGERPFARSQPSAGSPGAVGRAAQRPDPSPADTIAPDDAVPPPEVSLGPAIAPAVRVDAAKLDGLLAEAGEILIASHRVQDIARSLATLTEGGSSEVSLDALAMASREAERSLRRATESFTETTATARMLPFFEICTGLDRVVRDIARGGGKQATLVVEGGDVEVDRRVLSAIRDPLVHLVRNAVDHGIEPPDARRAAGKDAIGTVRVRCLLEGSTAQVAVSDDGAGIDVEAVKTAAVRAGVRDPDAEAELDAVFAPGVSTARSVTTISGRGVGLDAVRRKVEDLGGSVRVDSAPAEGTTIALTVPVMAATARVLLVKVAGEIVALALSSVERVLREQAGAVRVVESRAMLTVDGAPVPVARLDEAIGFEPLAEGAAELLAVLVSTGGGRAALAVDAVLEDTDVVVRPLPPRLANLAGVVGAAVLEDGRPALILNAASVARRAVESTRPHRLRVETSRHTGGDHASHVVLAEDSVTTRVLERTILEAAGYRVTATVDGADAWRALQESGADAVVSDVDMPRMSGLELCKAIRRSGRFRDLPVVLVTSLASDEERARGMEAGADAYMVKSAFDQQALLAALERLLG